MLIQLTELTIYNAINGDLIAYYPDWTIDDGSNVPMLEFAPDDPRILKGVDATKAWECLLKVAEMDRVDMAFDHERTLEAAEKYNNPPEESDF